VGSLEATTRTGRFTVDVSPNRAIGLFTAEGERGWVDDWEPRYPAGGDDRDRVGTVFVTAGAEGADVVWVVTHVGELERFAAGYEAMMEAWGARIRAALLPRDD
jgi:hypothetical protein